MRFGKEGNDRREGEEGKGEEIRSGVLGRDGKGIGEEGKRKERRR
jgi:hypothetical protein